MEVIPAFKKMSTSDQPSKENEKPILSRKKAGSNWQSAAVLAAADAESASNVQPMPKKQKKKPKHNKNYEKMEFVAMDCEMVGTGPDGAENMLARVSIVNEQGQVLLDKFVKPREKVTDYRTKVSGIRPTDIINGEEFDKVQDEVIAILQHKTLVGHSIHNDLRVLFIRHPAKYIRDTARYRPLASLVSDGHTPSLKRLSKAILGLDIQTGEHNSVEDARATMSIYKRVSGEWEKHIKKKEMQKIRRHT